jgi:GTPase SAR1 family protein
MQQQTNTIKEYKLLITGTWGVGKTRLVLRFTRNEFSDEVDPTDEEAFMKTTVIDGEECLVKIFGTLWLFLSFDGLYFVDIVARRDRFFCVSRGEAHY